MEYLSQSPLFFQLHCTTILRKAEKEKKLNKTKNKKDKYETNKTLMPNHVNWK